MANLSLPGMHAQFQVLRQLELLDGQGHHGQVRLELPPKLGHVAHVIDALVEPAGKPRGNRLGGYALLGHRGQNQEQLDRGLRPIGFVQRHFDHRRLAALGIGNAAIDAARLADRSQKLPRRLGDHRPGDLQRPGHAGYRERTDKTLMPGDKLLHGVRPRVDADPIGHVEREEIAGLQKGVHGLQADVVGIDEIRSGPAAGPHRRVRLGPNVGRDGCLRSCARGATCSIPGQCRALDAGPESSHPVGPTPGAQNGRQRPSNTWVITRCVLRYRFLAGTRSVPATNNCQTHAQHEEILLVPTPLVNGSPVRGL